ARDIRDRLVVAPQSLGVELALEEERVQNQGRGSTRIRRFLGQLDGGACRVCPGARIDGPAIRLRDRRLDDGHLLVFREAGRFTVAAEDENAGEIARRIRLDVRLEPREVESSVNLEGCDDRRNDAFEKSHCGPSGWEPAA